LDADEVCLGSSAEEEALMKSCLAQAPRWQKQGSYSDTSRHVQNLIRLVRSRQILLLEKAMPQGSQQSNPVSRPQLGHKAGPAPHDLVKELKHALRSRFAATLSLGIPGFDVIDAHRPTQQHIRPPENSQHGKLAGTRGLCLAGRFDTQQKMIAAEGTVSSDGHNFIEHVAYVTKTPKLIEGGDTIVGCRLSIEKAPWRTGPLTISNHPSAIAAGFGCGHAALYANYLGLQQHSESSGLTDFVFRGIPASFPSFSRCSLVFNKIPASLPHFLKLLLFSERAGNGVLSACK
jgi:hypothetical protein